MKTVTNPYREGLLGKNRGLPAAARMKPVEAAAGPTSYSRAHYIDNHFTTNYTLVSAELLERQPKQMYDRRRVQRSVTELISPLDHSRAPTKESVTTVLTDVARKALLAYDTRVVEVGATLRACVDIRHPVPGIAAVMSLHRCKHCELCLLYPFLLFSPSLFLIILVLVTQGLH